MPRHDVRGLKHKVECIFPFFGKLLLHPILTVRQLPDLGRKIWSGSARYTVHWGVLYAGNVFSNVVPAPLDFEAAEHSHE